MVGQALVKLREVAGKTQADVAEDCGVVATTVGRWERGRVPVPRDKIDVYAEALGVSSEDIRELRGSRDEPLKNPRRVGSRLDIYRWRNAIAESTLDPCARAILCGIALFVSESSWVASFTEQQFLERTNLDPEMFDDCWDQVMGSGFLRNENPQLRHIVELKFPADYGKAT